MMLAFAAALSGCRRQTGNGTALNIVCAPENLNPGEAATLSILQISPKASSNLIVFNAKSLEEKALIARFVTTSGATSDGAYAYRLQLFRITPIAGHGPVVIGRAHFENLPPGAIVAPMKVQVVP
jgi:hypothetical protein